MYTMKTITTTNNPLYTNQDCLGSPSIQPSSGNFGWYIKLEQAISVKIVVPSTALLYSAYKDNNQTRGGLVRDCATERHRSIGHVECPNF